MKMEPIVSSETSAIRTQTPENYPKRNKLQMIECLHNYTSTYARKQGYNWTKKHLYEHVPKSVEISQGGTVTRMVL